MEFTEEHSEAVVEFDDDISHGYSEPRDFHAKDPDTGIENLNEIPPSLRYWNVTACILQFGQAGAMLWLTTRSTTVWPIYTFFQASFGIPFPQQVGSYSVLWLAGIFLALSGLDHFLSCCPGICKKYEYYIERYQNPFRWTEYAFTASIMRVMIAELVGITDIHSLVMIFMLTATTMVLGFCHESVNAVARADSYRQNWCCYLTAWIPHLTTWGVIVSYFAVAASRYSPSAYLWSIVLCMFVLDLMFALLFYMQWGKVSIFRDYVIGEVGFIVLSIISKATLAWLAYFEESS